MRDSKTLCKPFNIDSALCLRTGLKSETRRLGNWQVQLGDVILVQEPFRLPFTYNDLSPAATLLKDPDVPVMYEASPAILHDQEVDQQGRIIRHAALTFTYRDARKRQARFMPKQLCRQHLQVRAVRTEPLLDITDEDATNEGITYNETLRMYQYGYTLLPGADSPRAAYLLLWDKINPHLPASTNPQVWVYYF